MVLGENRLIFAHQNGNMSKEVKPYQAEGSKKEQVAEMFDNISERYDLLNHVLSLSIDKGWRKKVVKMVAAKKPKLVLDVATGTADLAIALEKAYPDKITGIDISAGMLDVGRKKVAKKGLSTMISLEQADSENLPFGDETFDAITVAFGVRNFENLEKGLNEMRRVLKPGGHLLVLEFSQPQRFPFKQFYSFYFKNILPTIGKLISKDARAYTYLPESVQAFPHGTAFVSIMEKCGYKAGRRIPVTFGIATIYEGLK
jgi:demethylmenaquinone methyltransferase/2-methoxy-6-polyprenyl-1,4-benzoquinol methylase